MPPKPNPERGRVLGRVAAPKMECGAASIVSLVPNWEIASAAPADRGLSGLSLLYPATCLVLVRDDAGAHQHFWRAPIAEIGIAGSRPGDHADVGLREPRSHCAS